MKRDAKADLRSIFDAGVAAVAPDAALRAHVKLDGDELRAGGKTYDLGKGRVFVCGAGKGAAPMAVAIENTLGNRLDAGVVVVKYGHELPTGKIRLIEASHPTPDRAGERGARACLEIARATEPDDLLICPLTGGASSLLAAPTDGLDLEELKQATSLLLASGAEINELNAIRKHLSAIGGGRLASAARGAVLSLIVSDVIGDDLATIASGPTAPDPTTYEDCLFILDNYDLTSKFPATALNILRAGAAGERPETPKPGDPVFDKVQNIIVASNVQALEAAARRAADLGYRPEIITEPLRGEAREEAAKLLRFARGQRETMKDDEAPRCLLAGGETTVKIAGNGKGGRNQEMALAGVIEIAGAAGVSALFAGTDGTDGPTDAAGGFALPDSLDRIGSLDEARAYLDNNDSNAALLKAGDLLITGPTRTNVMDLAIILLDA